MGDAGERTSCPFCRRGDLEIVLTETDHFYVLVDNAPLTEGHLLIVPHEHAPCFGAVPAAYDDELAALKARVSAFLERAYRSVCFFEHGVFRQTVYHAHLHAIPLGADTLPNDLSLDAQDAGGMLVREQTDIRAWFAAIGHYFFVEQTSHGAAPSIAALFPPNETVYFGVLARLVSAAGRHHPFQSQAARRLTGAPRMRSVAEAWARYSQSL